MIKVGLNGYGRIGRIAHRIMLAKQAAGASGSGGEKPMLEVSVINARSEDTRMRAHLLKYDSLHGKLPYDISHDEQGIVINGKKVECVAIKDANDIPWAEKGVG